MQFHRATYLNLAAADITVFQILTCAGSSVLGQPVHVTADTLEAALGVVTVIRAATVFVGAFVHVATLRLVPVVKRVRSISWMSMMKTFDE